MEVTGTIRRYYFDKAVWTFGSTLQGEIERAGEGVKNPKVAANKRQMVLARWLATPSAKGFYRDPAGAR